MPQTLFERMSAIAAQARAEQGGSPLPVLPFRAAHNPETPAPAPGPSRLLDALTPTTNEEKTMARGRSAAAKQDNEEVKQPDFEKAVAIFRQDIKPAIEAAGASAQEASTGYKAIKKDCRVNTRAAKFVFKLASESEEKRNDVLRSLRGLLGEMNIGVTDDLVSQAEGEKTDAPIIPQATPERPKLATVN